MKWRVAEPEHGAVAYRPFSKPFFFAADWSSLDVCIRIQIEDELLWLLGENFVVLCTIWVSCVELASEYSMQLTILKTNLVHD
jgi:hypothetical protein